MRPEGCDLMHSEVAWSYYPDVPRKPPCLGMWLKSEGHREAATNNHIHMSGFYCRILICISGLIVSLLSICSPSFSWEWGVFSALPAISPAFSPRYLPRPRSQPPASQVQGSHPSHGPGSVVHLYSGPFLRMLRSPCGHSWNLVDHCKVC